MSQTRIRKTKRRPETFLRDTTVQPETVVSALQPEYMEQIARDTEEAKRLFFELKQDVRKINAPSEVVRKMDRLAELFGVNVN